jgi:hypothetical protein
MDTSLAEEFTIESDSNSRDTISNKRNAPRRIEEAGSSPADHEVVIGEVPPGKRSRGVVKSLVPGSELAR